MLNHGGKIWPNVLIYLTIFDIVTKYYTILRPETILVKEGGVLCRMIHIATPDVQR